MSLANPTELKPLLERVAFRPDGMFTHVGVAADLLSFLVQHNTGSSHDETVCKSNVELVHALRQELKALGLETRYETEEYPKGSGIMQATLVARMGPAVKGGVVLSGHTDVIPVTDEDKKKWVTEVAGETVQLDPFKLSEAIPGRLTARGAVDMKQAIVNYMAIAEMYAKDPEKLAALEHPIYIALSWGEEIGMKGMPMVNRVLKEMGADPELIIVGEPTDEKLVVGHKGAGIMNLHLQGMGPPDAAESHPAAVLDVDITGNGGHSAFPERYINAALYAARLIQKIEERQQQYNAETGRMEPLVTVSALQAGTAPNGIPKNASLQIQVRTDGAVTQERIMADMQAIIAEQRHMLEAEAANETKWVVDPQDNARKAPNVSITEQQGQPATMDLSNAQAIRYAKNAILALDALQAEYKADETSQDIAFTPSYPCINAGVIKISGNDHATLEICARSTAVVGPEALTGRINDISRELDTQLKAEAATADRTDQASSAHLDELCNAKVLPSQDRDIDKLSVLKKIQAGLKELGKTDDEVRFKTEPYGTDAAELADAFKKATTVVYGTGDIWTQNAHQPLEYIKPEQLRRGSMFPLRMIYEFCLAHNRNYPDPWMMPTAIHGADMEIQQAV